MKTNNIDLFENKKISSAVISLAIPTVVSQIITVIYNIADTFFIGKLNNPNMVAAASIVLPLFILLNAISNLFGIGAASLISRALGNKDFDKAKKCSIFSIYTSIIIGLVYGLVLYFLRPFILPLIGANSDTYEYCYEYMVWTITIGSVPTVFNLMISHIIRSQGYSKEASIGMTLGGVLNIILDPIFIFAFNKDIIGAAMATMLSNLIASVYFVILLIIKNKNKSIIVSIDIKKYPFKDIPKEILLVGLPSALMTMLAVFSNINMNKLMESYCNEAIAAIGIAKKIDLLAFAIAMGISQGVLPLIGYNYSSNNIKRMKDSIKFTFILTIGFEIIATILLFVLASPIINLFIDDELTVNYGSVFQKIICIAGPFIGISLIISTVYQSLGYKVRPLIISILRKGGVDIPAMYLLNYLIGENGIPLSTFVAEFIAVVFAIITFIPFVKKINSLESKKETIIAE